MIRGVPVLMAAPGDMAGVPAFAQTVQQDASGKKRRSDEASTPVTSKKPRRKQGDYLPVPTGDPFVDVPRMRAWAERGRGKKNSRMEYRGRMMDLEEAETLLEQEKIAVAQALVSVPQQWLQQQQQQHYHQQQHAGYLQGRFPGFQCPIPEYKQAPMPALQAPLGMPPHVNPLQNPFTGFLFPFPQQSQAFTPALQPQSVVPPQPDFLQSGRQHLAPDLQTINLPVDYFDFEKFEGVGNLTEEVDEFGEPIHPRKDSGFSDVSDVPESLLGPMSGLDHGFDMGQYSLDGLQLFTATPQFWDEVIAAHEGQGVVEAAATTADSGELKEKTPAVFDDAEDLHSQFQPQQVEVQLEAHGQPVESEQQGLDFVKFFNHDVEEFQDFDW